MRIVVADEGQERELDVRGAKDARVADLCEVLFGGSPDADSLYVEGREVAATALVTEAGIAAGARLGLEPPQSAAAAAVDLQVLSGPGAGGSIGLPSGTHVVGSGSGANVAYRASGVRARHAALHVGGDGRVSVGPPDQRATHAVTHTTMIDVGGPLLGVGVRRSSADKLRAMPGRRGTVAFNRPPRPMPVAEPISVTYPEALKPPTMSSRFSMISLIVPVVFGLTLAILIHPRMALFAMLGPVMMIGSWFEDRRRKRKYVKESAAQDEHDSAVVTAALDRAAVDEVVRRHRAHPRVAELAGWPQSSTRLWERRRHHFDFMRLVAGYGAAPWRPPTEGNPTAASDLIRSLVGSRTRLPRDPWRSMSLPAASWAWRARGRRGSISPGGSSVKRPCSTVPPTSALRSLRITRPTGNGLGGFPTPSSTPPPRGGYWRQRRKTAVGWLQI